MLQSTETSQSITSRQRLQTVTVVCKVNPSFLDITGLLILRPVVTRDDILWIYAGVQTATCRTLGAVLHLCVTVGSNTPPKCQLLLDSLSYQLVIGCLCGIRVIGLKIIGVEVLV